MRRISSNSESGAILLIVIILMLALTITGIAFLNAGVMEYRLAKREDYKNQAFYIAEGGLDRTLWNLKQDFVNGSEDWTDGEVNGVSVDDTPTDGWRLLLYNGSSDGSVDLGDGSYVVELKYVNDPTGGFKNDEIWVKSTGTVNGIPRTVQVLAETRNIFPWNNAIFAGIGAGAGTVLNGNSLIHGSVLILGSGLDPSAMAMDTTGTAGMRNNYQGMPDGSGGTVNLVEKVPLCPTTTFDGEPVDSLNAELRVKRGKVGLSGAAWVGQDNIPGNSLKETIDGVYVTDGFGGNQGAAHVRSDNGTQNGYDLGDKVEFPSLLQGPYVSPVTGVSYDTYLDYLDNESLHIKVGLTEDDDIETSEISRAFDFGSEGVYGKEGPYGAIGWYRYEEPGESQAKLREKVRLEIEGIVWIEADSLDLGQVDRTLEYSGSGTIVVASSSGDGIVGAVVTHGHILAKGNYDGPTGTLGFPNNALGIITGDLDISGNESKRSITGAFFAENQISSLMQNEVAGTFVSNIFYMGTTNVPRIYQVPELANKLPPGMPGGDPIWSISTSQWSEY